MDSINDWSGRKKQHDFEETKVYLQQIYDFSY